MPEPPRNYWRLVGPGIVAGGVGLSSGEFVLWPFIASQVGLVLLWGALRRRRHAVLSQHGSGALHAGDWRNGRHGLQPLLEALGTRVRGARLLRESVAGMGDQLGDACQLSVRWQSNDHCRRQSARHRLQPDLRTGGLRRARAAHLREGRRRARPRRSRCGLRDRTRVVAGAAGGIRQYRDVPRRIEHRAGVRRHRICRLGRRAESVSEQLDSRQGIRHGTVRAATGEPGDRRT